MPPGALVILFMYPRSQRSGVGIALLYRKTIKRGPVTSHDAVSFESLSCDFQLAQNQSPVKLVVIYRPPYSAKHRITSNTFFREFAEYLSFYRHHPRNC